LVAEEVHVDKSQKWLPMPKWRHTADGIPGHDAYKTGVALGDWFLCLFTQPPFIDTICTAG
jgi:hypothetical protein